MMEDDEDDDEDEEIMKDRTDPDQIDPLTHSLVE